MSLDKLFSGLTDSKSDPRSLLGGLLGSPGAQGALGGAASGAVVSMLMNKKARKKLQKNAVKVGGVAALAGVGYFAYRKWQNRQSPDTPPPAPASPALPPPAPRRLEAASAEVRISAELPIKMVLAMIAAAAADGNIDSAEMNALVVAIEEAPIEAAEKGRLTAALNEPPTVEAVAALAENPEEASELYGAALTAIDVDTPAEDFFLRRFARALELDPELVTTLHQTLEEA
jgi:uncharacterized membrane protein YebE (DUF533 family)